MKLCVYALGKADPNPGPGGWGAVIMAFDDKDNELKKQIISGGDVKTTNNRMNLTSVIEGLRVFKTPSNITVYSPAQYVTHAMNEGWSKKKNKDLWIELDGLCATHKVTFVWMTMKTGHEFYSVLEGLIEEQVKQYSRIEE